MLEEWGFKELTPVDGMVGVLVTQQQQLHIDLGVVAEHQILE
jgi:hypothetical protein